MQSFRSDFDTVAKPVRVDGEPVAKLKELQTTEKVVQIVRTTGHARLLLRSGFGDRIDHQFQRFIPYEYYNFYK